MSEPYHRIEVPTKQASIDYHLARLEGQLVRLETVLKHYTPMPGYFTETVAAARSHLNQLRDAIKGDGFDVT